MRPADSVQWWFPQLTLSNALSVAGRVNDANLASMTVDHSCKSILLLFHLLCGEREILGQREEEVRKSLIQMHGFHLLLGTTTPQRKVPLTPDLSFSQLIDDAVMGDGCQGWRYSVFSKQRGSLGKGGVLSAA